MTGGGKLTNVAAAKQMDRVVAESKKVLKNLPADDPKIQRLQARIRKATQVARVYRALDAVQAERDAKSAGGSSSLIIQNEEAAMAELPDRSLGRIQDLFDDASQGPAGHIREQLAYRHMIALADMFDEWSMDRTITIEQAVRLFGRAQAMRKLAAEVGPDWDPPTPDRLTITGFLGRQAAGEKAPKA